MDQLKDEKILVKAYGKINLTLEVLGIRDDGYHEIRSIMQNIELHDNIYLEELKENRIELTGNKKELEYGEKNLIYKAAAAIKEYTGVRDGVRIFLEKNIPLEAGLAGGSADAAATLTGLNKLWKLNLSLEELIDIGKRIGSDIPFCLVGNTALVEGRGEKVTGIKGFGNDKILIIKPDFGASTKLVYDRFDDLGIIDNFNYSAGMIDELEAGGDYKKYLHNALEKVTTSLYGEVQDVLDEMRLYLEYAMMSGSGPTCFGFGDDDMIKYLYDNFKRRYEDVYVTTFKK